MALNLRLILNNLKSKNKISYILFALLLIGIPAGIFLSISLRPSINVKDLSDYSKAELGETNFFILQKDKGFIYKSDKTGLDAALDFIKANPSYNNKKLLPSDFDKNSSLSRSTKDTDDDFLKNKNINISNEHYFFEQKINGIPVFGSSLVVHLRNKNEIYSVTGNLSNSKLLDKQKIKEDRLREIALTKANQEEPRINSFIVQPGKQVVFNGASIGLSNDSNNYLGYLFEIRSENENDFFSKRYIVDSSDGDILYEENLILEAKSRSVYDCNGTPSSCPLTRSEGSGPTGDTETDRVYDILGDIYDYYFNTFNRDSVDGRGGTMKANVHKILLDRYGEDACPNAQFSSGINTMSYCTGMVVKDITAHEFTHGITFATANLIYQNQSGALNESISDIFANALDDNWSLGEGSVTGIIRYLDDPTRRGSPDKLFSSRYWCSSGDGGGVHTNSGVMNKTFYLMSEGGNFNGCAVTGIGRSKAHPIIYQTLTKYLTSSSNFKGMHDSILQACNDLYSGSGDCENVQVALQSTEMDQQPIGTQTGPVCQSIARQVPACAGGAPQSTATPTPTEAIATQTPTPTPTISQVPGDTNSYLIHGVAYDDKNRNRIKESGESGVQGVTVKVSNSAIGTRATSTDSTGYYAFTQLQPGVYNLIFTYNSVNKNYPPFSLTTSHVKQSVDLAISGSSTIPITPKVQPSNTPIPTATPTVTPRPGDGEEGGGDPEDGEGESIPQQTYTCKLQEACARQKKLQLCPLICTPN